MTEVWCLLHLTLITKLFNSFWLITKCLVCSSTCLACSWFAVMFDAFRGTLLLFARTGWQQRNPFYSSLVAEGNGKEYRWCNSTRSALLLLLDDCFMGPMPQWVLHFELSKLATCCRQRRGFGITFLRHGIPKCGSRCSLPEVHPVQLHPRKESTIDQPFSRKRRICTSSAEEAYLGEMRHMDEQWSWVQGQAVPCELTI